MAFLITFLILVIFWIFMSGLFDIWHFGLGILSCALVAHMSKDLFFPEKIEVRKHFRIARAFIAYIPWLLYQIYLANIYVIKIALSPNLKRKIHPHVYKFRTKLKSELAISTFANSITLTPGTITLHIEGDYFYVHALDIELAESLPGEMEERVARIFGEDECNSSS